MQITLTPEDLKKYESAVKEHQGKKMENFVQCLRAFYDPMSPDLRQGVVRALQRHKEEFKDPFPTISKVLGLD